MLTAREAPDDVEDAVEVGFDLADGLRQQPPVGAHAHVGHPVDGHQGLQQPAEWMQGRVASLRDENPDDQAHQGFGLGGFSRDSL